MIFKRLIPAVLILLLICSCSQEKQSESRSKPVTEDTAKVNSEKLAKKVENDDKPIEKKSEQEKLDEKSKKKDDSYKIKSISELWATYKKAKNEANEAIENGEIKKIVEQLNIAGESALELGRDDIAAWQFNNVGHYSIEEFKKRTDYENRIRAMATMSSGKEKTAYISSTKEIFTKEKELLKQAETGLQRAQIIDDELEKSRRTEIIERNLDFINWVKEFIK